MASNYFKHKFLNYVLGPIILLFICIILPPLLVFRFLVTIKRYFTIESVKDKVVLITGASSGIGEDFAYEYARRGASLVLVARREKLLKEVAAKAIALGSPKVLPICGNVSDVNDCKQFIDETINQFGRLDHLVNNAGINSLCAMEDITDITTFKPMMDTNFWGYVYPTYFAIPHLKKTKGRIVVNASASPFLQPPTMSFYSASKAAVITLYEILRAELGGSITITILILGITETAIIQENYFSKEGVETNPKLMEGYAQTMPVLSFKMCAKAVVDGVCSGAKYITQPQWYKGLFMLNQLCPELFELYYRRSR